MTSSTDEELLTIISALTSTSMEEQLARTRNVKRLYALLGEPTEQDFPGVHNIVRHYSRAQGYTQMLMFPSHMMRQGPVDYRIKRPSDIKCHIIDTYYRDGWSITVTAYNVFCRKFIRHARITNLAVLLTSSRSSATYEYVLVEDTDDD